MVATGDDRFTMLDTIRAYAHERLRERGDLAALRERHARHYLAVVRDVSRARAAEQQAMSRLRAEHDQCRAALEWAFGPDGDARLGARLAAALAWSWNLAGAYHEGRRWLEAAVAASPGRDGLRANALFGLAIHTSALGRLAAAEELVRESAQLFGAIGDPRRQADALTRLSALRAAQGDEANAVAFAEEALGMYRALRADYGIGFAQALRGLALADTDAAAAAAATDEAVTAARRFGSDYLVAYALDAHARVAVRMGDCRDAQRDATESLALAERSGFAEGVISALQGLALVHRRCGGEPAALYTRSVELAHRAGHQGGVAAGLEGLAGVLAESDPAQAARLFGCARRLREEAGAPVPAPEHRTVAADRARIAAVLDPDRLAAELATGAAAGLQAILD